MGLRKMNRWTNRKWFVWVCLVLTLPTIIPCSGEAENHLRSHVRDLRLQMNVFAFLHHAICCMVFSIFCFPSFDTFTPKQIMTHHVSYVILGSVAQVLLKMCLGMFWLLDLFWWKQNTWRHLPPDLFVFLACQGRRVQSLARSPAPLHPHELCFALFLHLPWSPGTKTGQVRGMWHCMTLTLQSGCSICRLKNYWTNSICA